MSACPKCSRERYTYRAVNGLCFQCYNKWGVSEDQESKSSTSDAEMSYEPTVRVKFDDHVVTAVPSDTIDIGDKIILFTCSGCNKEKESTSALAFHVDGEETQKYCADCCKSAFKAALEMSKKNDPCDYCGSLSWSVRDSGGCSECSESLKKSPSDKNPDDDANS